MNKYKIQLIKRPGTGVFSKDVIVEGYTPNDAKATAEGMYSVNYTIGVVSKVN
jgi:hypothetical protein